MKKFLLPFFLFSSFSLFSFEVRVKLEEPLYIEVKGNAVLKGEKFSQEILSPWGWIKVREGKIFFRWKSWGKELEIIPKNRMFKLGKRWYPGKLKILVKDGEAIPVNILDIENYLEGVVGAEMPYYFPLEALKTQAVVSRTYALYSLNPQAPYDLTQEVSDQCYLGLSRRTHKVIEAVRETKREILTKNGKIIPAHFCACCGGYTEWAKEVWKDSPPYLCGVPDPYCRNAPVFQWSYRISWRKLGQILGRRIEGLEILEKSRSGRVKKLKIFFRNGEKIISGVELRRILGYSHLKSTLFRIVEGRFFVRFIGQGWGHGVGMCQWGAKGMAEKGYNYREILKFYFPFAEISKYEN